MKPPIIVVYEPGDVNIFQSIEDAERYLESPDVDQLIAYDSEGRFLDLKVPESKGLSFLGIGVIPVTKVTISSAESQPAHIEDLQEILHGLLQHLEVSMEWLEKATLDDLLVKSIEQIGFTR